MKKKKTLTLAEAKRNMIKSGLFAGAAILVLIVATVAWFSSGTKVDVEGISANIESQDVLITNFYKYIDNNKDNDTTNDSSPYGWIAVTDSNIDTRAMVPGQKSFYKVIIRSTKPNLRLDFNNIEFAGIPSGGDMTTLSGYLQKLNVEIKAVDGAGSPIGSAVSSTMNDLLENPTGDITTKAVFNVEISGHQNENITIYYTLEMSDDLKETDLAQGFNISIGEVLVVYS